MTPTIPAKIQKKVHIDYVRVGDTVLCPDGETRTVSGDILKKDPFIGTTLWGDSYILGYKPVILVTP